MNEIYEPSKNLSLDESIVLWHGRLVFRQYIKNKRHKYGVKLYMLTEPTGLVQKVLIYSGQGTDVSLSQSHTDVDLAHKLLEKKTYCTGTLRSHRKKNPTDVIKKKLNTGESISKYKKDGVCVTKWKNRREVLTISSEYNGELIEATNRRGNVKLKPNQIVQYNKFMSGVDRQDQMMAYYPCEPSRRRVSPVSTHSRPYVVSARRRGHCAVNTSGAQRVKKR
ncbi:piggyBac transposable element-derived protein 4-like [Aphis craccivora]|uniref:PiggyBac transposable element-derived protein 4-like n=1 Tax=Aphis craccivora TaxID=307492 RepID=A0A6G0Y7K8_APHCR|nr:piggyBac transposable element-derived protein 4-like [Aphis craccivora]